MANLPADHIELMNRSLAKIQEGAATVPTQAGAPMSVDPNALAEFRKGNICKFKEMFGNLTQDIFDRLMVVAQTHGALSATAARLQHPSSTTVDIIALFYAGKLVRFITALGGPQAPQPLPEPICPAAPTGGDDDPLPGPEGGWCDWPPVP
jgi:hypothetical protein